VFELPRRLGPDVVVVHQLGDGVDAAGDAFGLQLGVEARAAVAFLDLGMDGTDLHQESITALLLFAGGPRAPGVEARGGNPEGVTQQANGPDVLVLLDEGKDQRTSLAKKAVAFVKMSRSICRRLFSVRSWRSSASMAGSLM
jgi:hypothetical protein